MTPEKMIENSILSFLKINGIFCWKNQSVGIFDSKKQVFRLNRNQHHINGVSDILGILPVSGRFLAIEVKTNTGRLTDHQKSFLDEIQRSGGISGVCRSIKDAQLLLSDYLTQRKARK